MQKTKYLFDVELKNPVVSLPTRGDKIGLTMNVGVKPPLLGRVFDGKVSALGRIHYDAERGAFFLKDVSIEALELDGVPEKYAEAARKAAGVIATSTLDQVPVYELKHSMKEKAASWVLREVCTRRGECALMKALRADVESSIVAGDAHAHPPGERPLFSAPTCSASKSDIGLSESSRMRSRKGTREVGAASDLG